MEQRHNLVHIRKYIWLGCAITFFCLLYFGKFTSGRPSARALYAYAFALFEDGLKKGQMDAKKITELFLFAGDYTYFYGDAELIGILDEGPDGKLIISDKAVVNRLSNWEAFGFRPTEGLWWKIKSDRINKSIRMQKRQ